MATVRQFERPDPRGGQNFDLREPARPGTADITSRAAPLRGTVEVLIRGNYLWSIGCLSRPTWLVSKLPITTG
jgi:hypothetical protein